MLSDIFGYLIHYSDDIDPHRTFADPPAATGALMHPEILVEILKFVVHPLTQTRTGVLTRVVPGRVHREVGELAVVPGAYPLALQWRLALNFVVDVEAMAGRAQECADAAADAGPRHLIPQRRIKARLQFGRRSVRVVNLALLISHGVGMHLLNLFLVGGCSPGQPAAPT